MSTQPINPYEISMDELRAQAGGYQGENQPLPEPEKAEQPRDEQGRFIKAEESEPTVDETVETQTEEAAPAEAEPIVVEREIDLGDGSGVQVFRGVGATKEEALEALADEFAKAQENATKKIREMSAAPKAEPKAEPTLDPNNEFLLAQKLMDTPRAALREVLKEEFGLTPAEIKTKLAQAETVLRTQEENRIADQFMAATPDFYPCPQNGQRIERLMQIESIPRTAEGLQTAYERLKADGLLVQKPAEQAQPVARPRSSGLSARSGSPAPAPTAQEDPYKLSMEELLRRSGGYLNRF